MRLIAFISFFFLCLGCSVSKKSSTKPEKLAGTWVPVKQEMGGTSMPDAALKGQKLILKDSTYTVIAESTDKGVVRFNGDKMDIYGKDGVNTGMHFTAIYKYENDQLTICYNLKGDSYPDEFETKGKPLFFMSVFRRENGK